MDFNGIEYKEISKNMFLSEDAYQKILISFTKSEKRKYWIEIIVMNDFGTKFILEYVLYKGFGVNDYQYNSYKTYAIDYDFTELMHEKYATNRIEEIENLMKIIYENEVYEC